MKKDRWIIALIAGLISALLLGVGYGVANYFVNFKEVSYLAGLFLLPLMMVLLLLLRSQEMSFFFLNLHPEKTEHKNSTIIKELVIHLPYFLIVLGLGTLLMALARPQLNEKNWSEKETEGIEIMLTLDVSTSMLAEDLRPNRLEASKNIAQEFIASRPNDKIGISLYAGEAFLQCPSTTDHPTLFESFKTIVPNRVEDGTSIGAGLAQSLSSLKASETKSKIIILLTDGVNNVPAAISPLNGAEIAKTLGIRIYTIGVGSKGEAPYPTYFMGRKIMQSMPVEIDEDLLKDIAKITGGRYFRATDNKSLKEVYADIDQMEKQFMKVTQYSKAPEAFHYFLYLSFALFATALLCSKLLTPNLI